MRLPSEPTENPTFSAETLICLIESNRFDLSTETALQRGLRSLFTVQDIPFEAEVILSPKDRIDFLIGGIGIEAKIKASRRDILRQLDRYAALDRIEALILATATPFVSGSLTVGGKKVLIANLSRGWL